VKEEVKSTRRKAVGTQGPTTSYKKPPMTTEQLYLAELPVMPEAEVAEPVAETVPEPKSAIDLELKEKVDGYVKEKLNAERNKRLRQGKGHMSKSELAKLRKILKREARAKFVVDDGYVGSPENEKPSSTTHTTQVMLNQNASRAPSASSPTSHQADMQRSAREDARRFLESQSISDVKQQLQFDSPPQSVPTMVTAEAADDDSWWQSEEAKWKAELEDRRQEGQAQHQVHSTPPRAEIDDVAGSVEDNESDICLRSQTVIRNESDSGLGIQLYTPIGTQGVRICKIVPTGPFGRTGAFSEGDVIVEIDGQPLLYGGHAAVLSAIQNSMSRVGEMLVTVCSPAELAKLEALVEDDSIDEYGSSAGSPPKRSQKSPKQGSGWLARDKWASALASVSKGTKSMIKPFEKLLSSRKVNPDGTVGTIRGAPAWWKETDGKKPSMTKSGVNSERSTSQESVPGSEPAYLIYRAEIYDIEAYKNEYMCKTTEIISKYGGRWLARGGKVEKLEGSADETVLQRMVLIEFPSMMAARNFFHSAEYQEARHARLSIATAELTVLEGMVDGMP